MKTVLLLTWILPLDEVERAVLRVQGAAQRRGIAALFQGVVTKPCACRIVQFTPEAVTPKR